MNAFRTFLILTAVSAMFFMPFAHQAGAVVPGPKVSEYSATGNKHNLSARTWPASYTGPYSNPASNFIATNPNTYKATDDPTGNPKGQQICIFCHTPHSANVEGGAPLWNRAFSTQTFSRYSAQSSWLAIRHFSPAASLAQYGQPDGSSKLCLSCHDGVLSLGGVRNGGPIAMTQDVISFAATGSIASFKPSTTGADKMKTGHHPVSFVFTDAVATQIGNYNKTPTFGVKPPSSNLTYAKLDKNNKIQCTTCHNPHQNQSHDDKCYQGGPPPLPTATCNPTYTRKVAPFWVHSWGNDVVQDRDNLCKECHSTGTVYTDYPNAGPWTNP